MKNSGQRGEISADQILPDLFASYLIFPFSFDNQEFSASELADAYNNSHESNWRIKPFKLGTGRDYNEFVYFYPYVRDMIFNLEKKEQGFRYLKWDKGDYDYRLWAWPYGVDQSDFKDAILYIDLIDIHLHLYDFGVGILIFEIKSESNSQGYSLEQFIRLLNLCRRLYPPFVKDDEKLSNLNDSESVSSIFTGECPVSIDITTVENIPRVITSHNFMSVNQWNPDGSPALSRIITSFLDIETKHFSFLSGKKAYWSIVDDRMFVHSFYRLPQDMTQNKVFIDKLKKFFRRRGGNALPKSSPALDCWYKMIFIDVNDPTCQNPVLKEDILKDASYTRWTEYGTFYGFSRFSSVTLTMIKSSKKALKSQKKDFSDTLFAHFSTMYYQIAVMLFFYRGALLAFSKRSADIAKDFQYFKKNKQMKRLTQLRSEFLLFRNRYWFKEVTAQDQGIEMFNQWSRQLNNFYLMEDIQSEIDALYSFANYQNELKENRSLSRISFLGFVLLPITIVVGFWGMNMFEKEDFTKKSIFEVVLKCELLTFFVAPLILLLVILGVVFFISNRE